MPNRIVTAAVSGEKIKLSNRLAGASGSHNAVSLSLTFDSAWDGTTKKIYFFDRDGENPVFRLLTADLLVNGAYIVPIPSEPLAKSGDMTITIRGVEMDGETAERIIMSASTNMRVDEAVTPDSDIAPVEPTPTQAEQLLAALNSVTGMTAAATTLPTGTPATVSKTENVDGTINLNFGVPTGATGAKGDKGDKGEQGIQGPKGDKGEQGEQGIQGFKGDKGDPFIYTDFTQPQLEGLRGPKGDKGDKGEKGDTGNTGNGIASVTLNPDYTLTITYTSGATATTTSIRGATGEKGATGDTGATGNGIASVVRTSGTGAAGTTDTYTITFTNATTTTFQVYNGADGEGAGDMLATVYDPTGKNQDVFGYVDNKVKTDVPDGAVFTDTITTVNGKTGAISKSDITALGIPAQDTVYTHPANHPPSIITQDASNRFVTDTEKSAWNGKANASHTHTKANITDFPESMTPTAHKSTHSVGGADALIDADIGLTPAVATALGLTGNPQVKDALMGLQSNINGISLLYEKIRDITDTSAVTTISLDVSDIDWTTYREIKIIGECALSAEGSVYIRVNSLSSNYLQSLVEAGTDYSYSGSMSPAEDVGIMGTLASGVALFDLSVFKNGSGVGAEARIIDGRYQLGRPKYAWSRYNGTIGTLSAVNFVPYPEGATLYLKNCSIWGVKR